MLSISVSIILEQFGGFCQSWTCPSYRTVANFTGSKP